VRNFRIKIHLVKIVSFFLPNIMGRFEKYNRFLDRNSASIEGNGR